jgi:hypothetical protein
MCDHVFHCFANTGSEADGTIDGWECAILPRLKDRDNDPLSQGGQETMLLPNPVKQGQDKVLRRREEVRQQRVVDAIRTSRGVT